MFPHRLTDTRAFDIAQAHARRLQPPLPAVPRGQRRRPRSASRRPTGTASSARSASASSSTTSAWTRRSSGCSASSTSPTLSMDIWQQVKLHYIGLLTDHHQPELAETFFNSVTAKLLHRSYFRNDFIFVRPARQHRVHRERRARRRCPPTAPTTRRARRCARRWLRIVDNFQLQREFEDLERDIDHVLRRDARRAAGRLPRCAPTSRSRCCRSLFYPQQGRLRGRQDHQRLHRDAVRAADPAQRRAASWSSTPRCSARTTC